MNKKQSTVRKQIIIPGIHDSKRARKAALKKKKRA